MKDNRKNITIRFYASLNDFIPLDKKQRPLNLKIKGKPAILDIIESLGIPHPEIDRVIINGNEEQLSKNIEGGEYISVYPVGDFDPAEIDPRFILDVHLGKLCRKLRFFGFDVLYENNYMDEEIIEISVKENRIILTRDIGLLKNGKVSKGYFVRHTDPKKQLVEILRKFKLKKLINPFTRCIVCNGKIVSVDKSEVEKKLLPKTKKYYNKFYRCIDCENILWEGSHYENMKKYLEELKKE